MIRGYTKSNRMKDHLQRQYWDYLPIENGDTGELESDYMPELETESETNNQNENE